MVDNTVSSSRLNTASVMILSYGWNLLLMTYRKREFNVLDRIYSTYYIIPIINTYIGTISCTSEKHLKRLLHSEHYSFILSTLNTTSKTLVAVNRQIRPSRDCSCPTQRKRVHFIQSNTFNSPYIFFKPWNLTRENKYLSFQLKSICCR